MRTTFERTRAPFVRQFQRTLQLFWTPGTALADLDERPGYFVPLAIATIGVVCIGLVSDSFLAAVLESTVQSTMDSQRATYALEFARRFQIVGYALTPLFLTFRWLAVAGLLFVTVVVLNGSMSFRASFCLIASVEMFSLIESGFTLLVVFLRGSDRVAAPADLRPPIGVNLLLPDAREPLYTLLGAINLFEIWYLVVLLIGVRALNRFSYARASVAVLVVWVFITSLRVALAMYLRT